MGRRNQQRLNQVRLEAEITRDHARANRKPDDPLCVRECLATVRMMLALGWDDDKCCIEFGVSPSKLQQYKNVIMMKERARFQHRAPEELFIDYRLMMMDDAEELVDIANKAKKSGQLAAATNARKARAAIIDKIMDRGQDMGVIPRAAKRTEVIAGVMVAHLTDVDLVAQISETASATREMLERYGSSSNFREIAPPSLADVYKSDNAVIDAEPIKPEKKAKTKKKVERQAATI